MNDSKQIPHRRGAFKQVNKIHKTGRHRSKGSISISNKGRIELLSHGKNKREIGKEERRNQAKQLRKIKREEFVKLVRSENDPPHIVALISLIENVPYFDMLKKLSSTNGVENVWYTGGGYCVINVPRFKKRFMFVTADINRIYPTLNTLQIADSVLFLTSIDEIENGDFDVEHLMTCILGQGIPSNVFVSIVDMHKLQSKKKLAESKDRIMKTMQSYIPDINFSTLDTPSDIVTFFRILSSRKPNTLKHRDHRSYMLSEDIIIEKDDQGRGFLSISGYIRGKPLSPNDLIHITGWNDFKISKIEKLRDPYKPTTSRKDVQNGPNAVIETFIPDLEKQETLQSENIPDPMDAEQTWPTEEEIQEADERIKNQVKRVPKGFSDYQASWIPDSDAESMSGDEVEMEDDEENLEEDHRDEEMDVDSGDEDMEDGENSVSSCGRVTFSNENEYFPIQPDEYDRKMNIQEENKSLEKMKEIRSDKMFPDEVDTPMDIPARERFQKYRGLKSLRTSPWDPKENLPSDYARIFQFQSFKRTENRIKKELLVKDGVVVGSYVRIFLEGVTEQEFNSLDRSMPLIVTAILKHEQKMSVLNMLLKRPAILESNESLKSKEELVIQCGYRRFKCCPIFSDVGNGNAHKYQRFFHPNATVVATTYAPIQFPPSPVLVFKENSDSSVELVASGRLLSVNPDRIVVKRTILSGHPFKVNRKMAVIRFMFFNAEDVQWFKPVELTTKYGSRGHIKEPLGTHGHMKCVFDKQLTSQDTVLLNLYKRVYPKWTYTNLTTALH